MDDRGGQDIGGQDIGALGVDALLADLARWTGDSRSDEAARSRTQERWLRQQAVEDARFAGLLLDLSERGVVVALGTTAGSVLRGRIAAVAADFVLIAHSDGGQVCLVALGCLATVRPEPGRHQSEATADRAAPLTATLADVLAGMAADRPRVRIVGVAAAGAVTGELRAVGADVMTLRLDGRPPPTVYLAVDAVSHLTVL